MPNKAPAVSNGKHAGGDGSPSKRQRPTKREFIKLQDRSHWRPSTIPENITIRQTAAMKNYHMGRKRLRDIDCETREIVLKIKGHDTIVHMYLYKERDVELKAWEIHGGPEGFETFLNDRRDKWYRKYGAKPGNFFPQPRLYVPRDDPGLRYSRYPEERTLPQNRPDPETSTAALLRMKQMMEQEGNIWLWDKLNEEYTRAEFGGQHAKNNRESIITRAKEILALYDPRPSELAPESLLFNILTNVLMHVNWNEPYCREIYHAMIKIIEKHGLEGWKRARWLAYDEYAESTAGGLQLFKNASEYTWEDNAFFWLIPYETSDGIQSEPRRNYYLALERLANES